MVFLCKLEIIFDTAIAMQSWIPKIRLVEKLLEIIKAFQKDVSAVLAHGCCSGPLSGRAGNAGARSPQPAGGSLRGRGEPLEPQPGGAHSSDTRTEALYRSITDERTMPSAEPALEMAHP